MHRAPAYVLKFQLQKGTARPEKTQPEKVCIGSQMYSDCMNVHCR